LRDILQCHEDQFHHRVGSRKALSVIGDLPDREIQKLDRVGRVYHLKQSLKKVDESAPCRSALSL
jgi:hypothetical protein